MKRSHLELSIDVVIHTGILKNNQITIYSCFTFIPTSGKVYCASKHLYPKYVQQ